MSVRSAHWHIFFSGVPTQITPSIRPKALCTLQFALAQSANLLAPIVPTCQSQLSIRHRFSDRGAASRVVSLNARRVIPPAQSIHPWCDIRHDLFFVQRQMLPLAHNDLPVADDRAYIARAGIINQTRGDAVQRIVMRPAQIDQDDIGQFARRQIAQVIALPKHARALLCSDGKRLRYCQILRIAGQLFLSHRRQAHRLPKIKRVIADRAITAQADGDAHAPALDQVVVTHRQLGISFGTMRDADRRPQIRQNLKIPR